VRVVSGSCGYDNKPSEFISAGNFLTEPTRHNGCTLGRYKAKSVMYRGF
jgi:hypothetical protein